MLMDLNPYTHCGQFSQIWSHGNIFLFHVIVSNILEMFEQQLLYNVVLALWICEYTSA